ncbi:MAG: DUF3592 domain-containing protein [Lachnospiraceae bacterium]|nr:DUF3592 domain-containing protein [Lachnospiraceae bacterium]
MLEDLITILELIGLVLLSMVPVVLIFGIPIWLWSRRDKKKAENADTEIYKDSSTEDSTTAFFKKAAPYFGPVMLISGILWAVVGGNRVEKGLERMTAETTGYIQSSYYESDSDGDSYYETTVQVDIDGITYKRRKNLSSKKEKGTPYTVKYNPEDPSEFNVVDFDTSSGWMRVQGTAIAGMGLIFTLLGFHMKVLQGKREKTFGEGFE